MLWIMYLLFPDSCKRKVLRPIVKSVKSLKGVSFVDQLPFVQPTTNIHTAPVNLPGLP